MTNEIKVKKLTKKDRFNQLLEIPAVQADAEMVAFIEHEIELLSRKSTSEKKPTQRQIQGDSMKEAIINFMEPNVLYSGSDLLRQVKELDGESNQRVASLMKQLMEKEGMVERITEKGKVYWKLA
jgi:hypothetical protein